MLIPSVLCNHGNIEGIKLLCSRAFRSRAAHLQPTLRLGQGSCR
jgi:hypothetical protein